MTALTFGQQLMLAKLNAATAGVLKKSLVLPSTRTADALVRRGMVQLHEFGPCYHITTLGKATLAEITAANAQGHEYEPHPYEQGIRRDHLGRGMCELCGQLAGRTVHAKLNDRTTWS